VNLADEEWNILVDRLDGYSGSDIRSVVMGALYEPLRIIQSACHWKHNSGKVIYNSYHHFCCSTVNLRVSFSDWWWLMNWMNLCSWFK